MILNARAASPVKRMEQKQDHDADAPASAPTGVPPPAEPPATPLEYAKPTSKRMRVIATFPESFEAEMTAAVLKSEGIGAVVEAAKGRRVRPVSVAVSEDDARRVIEMLAATPMRRRLTLPESELPPARALPVEVCPRCGSPEIRPAYLALRLLLAAVALLPLVLIDSGWMLYAGLLAGWTVYCVATRPHVCSACRNRWRK